MKFRWFRVLIIVAVKAAGLSYIRCDEVSSLKGWKLLYLAHIMWFFCRVKLQAGLDERSWSDHVCPPGDVLVYTDQIGLMYTVPVRHWTNGCCAKNTSREKSQDGGGHVLLSSCFYSIPLFKHSRDVVFITSVSGLHTVSFTSLQWWECPKKLILILVWTCLRFREIRPQTYTAKN